MQDVCHSRFRRQFNHLAPAQEAIRAVSWRGCSKLSRAAFVIEPSRVNQQPANSPLTFEGGAAIGSYSGSAGSLNSTPILMLPWPAWGYPAVAGLAGSRFDDVSSGGNRTSVSRNLSSRL